MKSNNLKCQLSMRLVAAAIVATTAFAWQAGAQAQSPAPAPATQSSSERGVTVKVTPKPAAPGATEWEFAVVLDTHSGELGDDLVKTAVLLVDTSELRPVAWTGAAPGGHHREGVLKFPAPPQAAGSIELRIERAGETAVRVFRWDGAALR